MRLVFISQGLWVNFIKVLLQLFKISSEVGALFFFLSIDPSTNWRNNEKVFSKKKKFHLERTLLRKKESWCRQRQERLFRLKEKKTRGNRERKKKEWIVFD